MSHPHLPLELSDQVVDLLHDSRDTLKSCCLVSKSWVPRSRKHLFAVINFRNTDDVQSWNAVFPDPSTSPARYAKTLSITSHCAIAAAGAGEGCWVSAFSRVVQFTMNTVGSDFKKMTVSLVPFYGFSPILKSLHVAASTLTHSQIFNFARSFPLLEDLSIDSPDNANDDPNKQPSVTQPSTSPPFTGSLRLFACTGTESIASRLLSLPNGLHFRTLDLTWHRGADSWCTTALVEECRSTLEYIKIDYGCIDFSLLVQVNLSKATKLKHVFLMCCMSSGWILATLRTVTQNHKELESIKLTVSDSLGLNDLEGVRRVGGETACQEWLELDRLLVQLCESHSIRLEVLYNPRRDMFGRRKRSRMKTLLPEVAMGLADLAG